MNYDNHYTIQFARAFLELGKQGLVKIDLADESLLKHVLRNKITEYGIINLVDNIIKKYASTLKSGGVEYMDLHEADRQAQAEHYNNSLCLEHAGTEKCLGGATVLFRTSMQVT